MFLVLPDAKRLANVLVLNRPTASADLGPVLARRWMRIAGTCTKAVVIVGFLGLETWGALEAKKQYPGEPTPPDGWYAVTSFTADGEELPALASGGARWKTFVLKQGYVRLWWPDRATRLFKAEGDATKGHIVLLATDESGEVPKDEKPAGELDLAFAPDGNATPERTLDGRALKWAMTRQSKANMPLMNRGFHWISEAPYNR